MTKHSLLGRNGGASVFLCIILSAVILTEGTLYFASRLRGYEADLMRSMRLQMSQILGNYNESLLNNYGLYGLDESSVSTTIFSGCFSGGDLAVLTATPYSPITTDNLQEGISDFMQIRMPALASKELLTRFKGAYSEIINCDLFKKAQNSKSSQWLIYLKAFLAQKDKWGDAIKKVVDTVELIDITGKTKELEEFAAGFQQTLQRNSTLFLQGDSSGVLSDDILSPDNMSKILSVADNYLNFDMPGIVDSYMINEYALSFFDSKIENEKNGETETPESNVLGIPYSDVHGANRADLEYLLTGLDNEVASFAVAKMLVFDVRIISNFAAYLIDSEKMSKAKEIAEILSAAITLVSAGTVSVDPEILQFVVLYVWAMGQGFADLVKLLSGESIELFDISALKNKDMLKAAIQTEYRDYVGLFLAAVPQEWKLSRMLTIFKKDCSSQLYAGASLSAKFRGSEFLMEDTYDAYASA